ncbi:IS110 family transposase [Paralcaligenes sp. KSB-10]|jgi:transposase|uniref:IS110 family transposase n=1 Tax=Paralcaligenes sp. KSB-10 TaxID=2901142 RepID=UPI001E4EE3D6|nr:IS110 family transposase [Paralcaligenes sp. KSB-10]UHL62506.1 IS110 family transposase [Paralcaligenes sp. KSB-10]UHL63026.1 IS110 family transposase [Paralcaligenes sp. KSB-10]UHL65792.1 IS110 family transposase [Paralcaligenes sp. KSB-10]UHL66095.1 IS110 family transposase [Paralcaligenes sp. KSB-10]
MKITTIGLDLAKSVFQVHGVNAQGHTVLTRQLRREQLSAFFAKLTPCLIGMEACASAHHWARLLRDQGHDVRLIAAQFVKPYVKSNKNDAADAQAICEAVTRPSMRFVAIKSVEQQAVLSLHRAREGFVKARSAAANQIRGLLAEFGLILPQGIAHVTRRVPALLESALARLPGPFVELIRTLVEHLRALDTQVQALERSIVHGHRANPVSQRLAQLPGIGPITASALAASVGDPRLFKNGRQLAAWLGLVPRQHSSGGKATLLGISKRGDGYLRKLLLLGAQSVLIRARAQADRTTWLGQLLVRRPLNVVAIALANKNARIAWALMAYDTPYDPGHTLSRAR